ncbi:hypothetical protein [Kangiella shandongensis]|uniref:hypothetical protein n=1 Tax=Kangiella shandongensis TaxID=2763258 RepID=UPI001CC0C527|nr:hypothetical protein [Kangiella shandongensis]
MTTFSNKTHKHTGTASSAIITLLAIVVIGGGIAYFTLSNDQSLSSSPSAVTQSTDAPKQNVKASQPPEQQKQVSVDAEAFCTQLTEVGNVFNKEYTGGRVRENASYGPKAGCSWNGPSVTVYFGDKSYHRMSTGFGSEVNTDYPGLDFPAFKKETSTTTAGYEIRVKSDKGWTIVINDGRGLKQDITKQQYNAIAHIVNDVLNKHY